MMRRDENALISHISIIVLLLYIQSELLESKPVNLDSNKAGARAFLATEDVDVSSDTDVYDTYLGNNFTPDEVGITRGPPVLPQNNSQIIHVLARENVELKCPVISEPPPLYDWFKGEDRIDSSWERFELSSSRESNIISIRSVKHEDEGDYTCEAVNGFGKGSFTIHLVVTGEDPFKDNYLKSLPPNRRNGANPSTNNNSSSSSTTERPEILKDQLPREKNIVLTKGSNYTLKCEAKGNPRPNITWFKDNIQLGNTKYDVSHLRLINISENDAGFYKCEATNSYGKSTFEIMIDVEVGSWQERAKAEIVQVTPHNLTLFPGESGSITCLARFENEFQPYIFWVKRIESEENTGKGIAYNGSFFEVLNRSDIIENSKHLFASDLVLTNVSRTDAGSYHCVVPGRMGYTHSEAHVFIETDPALLLNIRLSKERAVTIQWAVFSCFVFLITTVLILACIYKMYSWHRQVKPNFSQTKNSPGRVFPHVSFFRCNNSVFVNTSGGDKSGGDTTVSTTLSNPNPSKENMQPLVDAHLRSASQSSPVLSASSYKFRYDQNKYYQSPRGSNLGLNYRDEHRYRHHHQRLVKPQSLEMANGVLDDSSHELHKLYNTCLNQTSRNKDCSGGEEQPSPDAHDFHGKESVSAYLSRSRRSSQGFFRTGPSSQEGSVASVSWSYASKQHQAENLNNNTSNNDLTDEPDVNMRVSPSGSKAQSYQGDAPMYVYLDHEHRDVEQYWDQEPEVFHDKNVNSSYYLNKNTDEYFDQGERLNKRRRRAQMYHKPRYQQPPSSPVSFYSNTPIIV